MTASSGVRAVVAASDTFPANMVGATSATTMDYVYLGAKQICK